MSDDCAMWLPPALYDTVVQRGYDARRLRRVELIPYNVEVREKQRGLAPLLDRIDRRDAPRADLLPVVNEEAMIDRDVFLVQKREGQKPEWVEQDDLADHRDEWTVVSRATIGSSDPMPGLPEEGDR